MARGYVLAAQARKDVDIELVVREDHEILEVLRIGAGVVVKPVQRIEQYDERNQNSTTATRPPPDTPPNSPSGHTHRAPARRVRAPELRHLSKAGRRNASVN